MSYDFDTIKDRSGTTGLWIIDGKAYGKAGEGYLRINAASPRSIVEDGMNRLKRGVEIQRSGK